MVVLSKWILWGLCAVLSLSIGIIRPSDPSPAYELQETPKNRQDCQPSDPTLFFGRFFVDRNSTQLFQIRFNTKGECTKSYLLISQGSRIVRTYCTRNHLIMQKPGHNGKMEIAFERYVQICRVNKQDQILLGKKIQYQANGQSSDGSPPQPYTSGSITTKIYDPQGGQSLQMIVVADWSQLYQRKYITLEASFNYLLNKTKNVLNSYQGLHKQLQINAQKLGQSTTVDGIIIAGDIAYDLKTQYGVNYVDFMKMLGQVSPYFPIIIVTGNHQRYQELDNYIFRTTFEVYDLIGKRHQALNFGNLGLVLFDPFDQIFKQSNPQKRKAFLQGIQLDLKTLRGSLKEPFQIVGISHYPLICSEPQAHCLQTLTQIPEVFSLMNDYGVSFYIGAHMHQYERLYPFYHGKFNTQQKGPYINIQGMVSVVEGAAPNQLGIIDFWYPKLYFSVVNTNSDTGFGLFKFFNNQTQSKITFQHYKTTNFTIPFDSVQVKNTLTKPTFKKQ